jgi:hypothetical protein
MANTVSIREDEIVAPGAAYEEVFASGVNQNGQKLVLRNTTAGRIIVRFNEDDDSIISVGPGEKITLGGFSNFRGQKIEAKTVTDVPSSLRVNVYG